MIPKMARLSNTSFYLSIKFLSAARINLSELSAALINYHLLITKRVLDNRILFNILTLFKFISFGLFLQKRSLKLCILYVRHVLKCPPPSRPSFIHELLLTAYNIFIVFSSVLHVTCSILILAPLYPLPVFFFQCQCWLSPR